MENTYISKKYINDNKAAFAQEANLSYLYSDLINFSIGDPDLKTDDRVIKLAFEDALNGHTHYTTPVGTLELRQAIVKYYKERFNFYVSTDEIMITTSANHAMFLAIEATLDEGDEVIIPTPHFSVYDDQIKLAKGRTVFLETYEEEDFQINIERLESKITDKTKGIIINTPNNPTGTCLSKKNLEDIAKIAKKYNLIIYADDIYTIYSFQEPFVPMASLEGMKERTITLGSFSKDYCMTGWRIGYMIGSSSLIEVVDKINSAIVYSAPSISQQAAIHALNFRESIQEDLVKEFRSRIFYTYERLKALKNVSIMSPRGTFYLFPNIKKTGLSSEQVTKKILEEAHVLVISGTTFGQAGEGFIRLACTLSIDKIKEAFDRIEKMDIFR